MYCQTETDCFLELYFLNSPKIPISYNLDFISDETLLEPDELIAKLGEFGFNEEEQEILFDEDELLSDEEHFKVYEDIVDNAVRFLELGEITITNCFANFFTKEYENELSLNEAKAKETSFKKDESRK